MNHSAEQRSNASDAGAAPDIEAGGLERVDTARRRALLRAAMASAPALVAASPVAAQVAGGSAYRAAQNDQTVSSKFTSGEVSDGTQWLGKLVDKGVIVAGNNCNSNPLYNGIAIYSLPCGLYDNAGNKYTLQNGQSFCKQSSVFVIGLFSSSDFSSLGLWPSVTLATGRQGLHLSAWTSIRPNQAAPTYASTCTGV